ncbi:aldehyde dehydrogenase family protein [Streptomyces flavidovirens]|uniref:aldehyde dehydrogenase family protein n=1 Tax=Streptomyces flavidovirens TaxID=67298 RepID=UPI0005693CB6|nr:aldehyde dehydrogenase family protein [Streptomyces flavidovirens]
MPAELIVRRNPARVDEVVGSVPVAGGAAVDRAVAAADAAARSWAGEPAEDRARALLRAADALDEVAAEAAPLLASESGKPLADCAGEIRFSGVVLRWYAEQAPGLLADRVTDDAAGRLTVRHRPFGAVAALTPWNAPVVLTVVKLAPALAAGNTLVVKPSPLAPLAVSLVLDTLARHFPPGLLHVLHGYADTARALAGHARIRKVSFTGGPEAGRAVGAVAAAALTPTTMELGGNDAAVLLDDARLSESDLERLVLASFATAGQVCMAAKRIYVPRRRYERFVAEYVAAAERALLLGDPLRPATTVGPVISAEAADRIRLLVADARGRGGRRVELGGVCPDTDLAAGHFVRPTLLLGLDDRAPAVREEQFGPVVPVLAYDDEDEVVARVNATEYGLGASVWSTDEDRAFAFAHRLEAGFRFVNTHNRTGMSPRAPFGGIKRSGHGREYGAEGLYAYTQPCVTHAPAAFRPGGPGMPPGAYPGLV